MHPSNTRCTPLQHQRELVGVSTRPWSAAPCLTLEVEIANENLVPSASLRCRCVDAPVELEDLNPTPAVELVNQGNVRVAHHHQASAFPHLSDQRRQAPMFLLRK